MYVYIYIYIYFQFLYILAQNKLCNNFKVFEKFLMVLL